MCDELCQECCKLSSNKAQSGMLLLWCLTSHIDNHQHTPSELCLRGRGLSKGTWLTYFLFRSLLSSLYPQSLIMLVERKIWVGKGIGSSVTKRKRITRRCEMIGQFRQRLCCDSCQTQDPVVQQRFVVNEGCLPNEHKTRISCNFDTSEHK